MKNTLQLSLVFLLLQACASLPSYHEMSCNELLKKEKSLQSDYKFNTVDSILSSIVDVVEDTSESTAKVHSTDVDLDNTKRELRSIQTVIYQKKCKARIERKSALVH